MGRLQLHRDAGKARGDGRWRREGWGSDGEEGGIGEGEGGFTETFFCVCAILLCCVAFLIETICRSHQISNMHMRFLNERKNVRVAGTTYKKVSNWPPAPCTLACSLPRLPIGGLARCPAASCWYTTTSALRLRGTSAIRLGSPLECVRLGRSCRPSCVRESLLLGDARQCRCRLRVVVRLIQRSV